MPSKGKKKILLNSATPTMPLSVTETSEDIGEGNVESTAHIDGGKVGSDHYVRHYIQPVCLYLEL